MSGSIDFIPVMRAQGLEVGEFAFCSVHSMTSTRAGSVPGQVPIVCHCKSIFQGTV
jgi:hypothetical protein